MKWVVYPLSRQLCTRSSNVRPDRSSEGLPPTPYTIATSARVSVVGFQGCPVWKAVRSRRPSCPYMPATPDTTNAIISHNCFISDL